MRPRHGHRSIRMDNIIYHIGGAAVGLDQNRASLIPYEKWTPEPYTIQYNIQESKYSLNRFYYYPETFVYSC